MATTPSQDDLATLSILAGGDEVVTRAVAMLAEHFRSSSKSPRVGGLSENADLAAAVHHSFPTPFAEEFGRWVAASTNPALDEDRSFANAFNDLREMWRQLTSFLPFIFMTTLNRISFGRLDAETARLLGMAITRYREFYLVEQQRQNEATRFDLLKYLLQLFRRLDHQGILGNAFVLAPLARARGGLAELIPERFEAQLELLQWLRNQNQHFGLDRRGPQILAPLSRLVQAVFLDAVAILRPICEAYQLVHVGPGTSSEPDGALRGTAFSGSASPGHLALRPPRDIADADRIEAGALYLIRRGAETDAEISPADCLNLTPFLIYQQAGTVAADHQPLFVFRRLQSESRRNSRSAWFEQFAARSTITADPGVRNDLRALLEAIDRFQSDLGQLVAAPDPKRDPTRRIFERTWEISLPHLGLIMDPGRYDPDGRMDSAAEPAASRKTFVEELFVRPPEEAAADGFLNGADRALLVTGSSGSGKSNLLCHLFLSARRSFRPALFLAGRQFTTANAEAYLSEIMVRGIHPDWGWSDLAAAQTSGPMPLIVIDAVNEYSGPGGPEELLAALIAVVANTFLMPRAQIVIGCRLETWDRFVEDRTSNPLAPALFRGGKPLRLSALEGEAAPAALYAAYRAFFDLEPKHYDELPPPARQLIRLPLMMSLLAETYAGAGPIPADIDYFRLFGAFTERKFDAARDLVPLPARLEFDERMEHALYGFAAELYAMLTAEGKRLQTSGGAALSMSVIDQSARLADARTPPAQGGVAPLWAAVGVGLLEQALVKERTFTGRERVGRVLHFFHDQYAQYWLSKVYDVEVLAPADSARDPVARAALAPRVAALLGASTSPLLSGALTHWLHEGLRLPPREADDLLLPLLESLSEQPSPRMRYWVTGFLATLLRRGIVAPETLFTLVLPSPKLAPLAAELFLEAWRDLPPAALCLLLRNPAVTPPTLARLADVFFQIFISAPEQACDYLAQTLRSLTLRMLTNRSAYATELNFTTDFAHRAAVASFGHPERATPLAALLRAKYEFVVRVAVGFARNDGRVGRGGSAYALSLISRALDPLFSMAWQKYAAGMVFGGNEQFLVPDRGVVQRDLVRDLVPALVAMHNRQLRPEAFARGIELRALLLRMMKFRTTSICSYYAALAASVACRHDPAARDDLIDDLAADPTDSGRFIAGLLIAHQSYLDPGETAAALATLRAKLLPWFATDRFDWEWPTLFALCTTASDPAQWPLCWTILREIMDDIDQRSTPGTACRLGDHLLKANFLGDGSLGESLLIAMLADGRLEQPEWREAVLKVAAGLLSRSPGALARAVGGDAGLLHEIPNYLTPELLVERDRYTAQVDLDRVIVTSLADNTKFSYLLIRDIVGGLVKARSLDDFGRAAKQCLIDGLGAVYAGLPDAHYAELTVSDVVGG